MLSKDTCPSGNVPLLRPIWKPLAACGHRARDTWLGQGDLDFEFCLLFIHLNSHTDDWLPPRTVRVPRTLCPPPVHTLETVTSLPSQMEAGLCETYKERRGQERDASGRPKEKPEPTEARLRWHRSGHSLQALVHLSTEVAQAGLGHNPRERYWNGHMGTNRAVVGGGWGVC